MSRRDPNAVPWFVPTALTSANPDPSNPQISLEDAREVFASLEKRNLITRGTLPMTDDKGIRKQVDVFIVNRDMKNSWEKLISKGGIWNMKASPVFHYVIVERWGWLVFVFVAGAFATQYCQELASDVYKETAGKLFKQPSQQPSPVNKP